jgi:uncharacterized protein DUF6884
MPVRIGLVGCVKSKGLAAAPAADLYVSPLFVGRRRLVEETCDRWFILSALHGLLDPDEVLEPYDQSLVEAAVGERRAWSQQVLASLDQELGDIRGVVFEVHAGVAYRDFGLVDGLRGRGAAVEVPGRVSARGSNSPSTPAALMAAAGRLDRSRLRPLPGRVAPGPAATGVCRSGWSITASPWRC